MKTPFEAKRILNNAFNLPNDVILWDILPIMDKEIISVYFESKDSIWEQGIWLMTDMGIEVNDQRASSIVLWYGKTPSKVDICCHTNNGYLNLYNVWDKGNGMNSQSHSSGMIIEELANGRRYKCNDIGFETNFNKLVFRVEKAVSEI
jgi:hypothetical protein